MAVNLAQPTPRPLPAAASDGAGRRIVDVAGASLLLLLALPLLLLGVLAVLVGSGRPVFFGHRRVGRDGRPFRCWKLRTMTRGAELWLAADPLLRERHATNGFKLPIREDPRITPVGRWLRRTHIDELPQLANVLAGSMSLVGPRPVVERELAHYGDAAAELLSTRPGIFGAWTSRGRARPSYPERARLELAYVRTRTLRGDVAILLRSVPVVLRGQES
jgi:lipopolysaccharide/colanic/teichoic acid biosynthesis glycosyltransferase